jgi:amino acid adenylation domain-containing protein
MTGQLHIQLEGATTNPEQTIDRMPLLSEQERRRLLEEWNATDADFPKDKCVHELLEEQARKTPHAIALVHRNQQLTFEELNQRANQLAHELRRLGARPDVCVGICMFRSLELVIALYAIHKAGAVYLPIDPAYPSERLAFMIEDAQAPLLVTQRGLESIVPRGKARILCVDAASKDNGARETHDDRANLLRTATPENLAYVIYTSGSTGKPKGVMVRHRNVVNFFTGMDGVIGRQPGTWLALTSISFDISVLEIFWTLTRGFKVIIQEDDAATLRKFLPKGASSNSKDHFPIADQIRRHHVTHLQCTPSLAGLMLDDAGTRDALREVKTFLFGGEPLPPSLVERLDGGGEIINMYGPTETTVWSTSYRVTRNNGRICIGRPIANTQIYILDSSLKPVPVGVPGELFIGGDGVARGYLNRPELTAERFIPDPFRPDPAARIYRTGDLARYFEDGAIEFLGRLDHQVKIRGHRIELGEVETALQSQPGVKEGVVSVWNAGPNDTRLIGYFVPHPGANPQPTELRRALRAKLPEYMVPSILTKLEKFPLTPNGKIDRKALPVPYDTSAVAQSGERELLDGEVATRVDLVRSVVRPGVPSTKGGVVKTLPLTEAQREIWLGAQVSDEVSCSFNQSVLLRLRGPLDAQHLIDTFQWLVKRHEALRVTFGSSGEEQTVHASMPVEIEFVDLSQIPVEAGKQEIDRLLYEEADAPFDLVNGPLFRVRLAKIASDEHGLFLTLHHLICDGGSLAVLVGEMGQHYSAKLRRSSSLATPEQTYSQFIQEQVCGEHNGERTKSEEFWLEQYSRPAKKLKLPRNKPRLARRKFTGESRSVRLSAALSQSLRRAAAQHHCTLTATLLAAYYVFLERLSGQSEIIIGLPISARSSPGSEGLVGHCVNFLPLRLNLEGDRGFGEHLKCVWTVLIRAIEHQNYTLGTLLEKLNDRDTPPSLPQQGDRGDTREHTGLPLPSVMFNLDWVLEPIEFAGLTTESKVNPYTHSRFDLSFGVAEDGEQLEVCCHYSTELFDSETIEKWLRDYELLLSTCVGEPARPLSQYPKVYRPTERSDSGAAERQSAAAVTVVAPGEENERGAVPETMTATEQTLAQIWREVVVLDHVGRHDSFFDVGGHSLLATKVISRITKAFNVELPVRVVFEAPTIAELAELVTRAQRERPKVSPILGRRSRDSEASELLKRLEQFSVAELQELLRDPKLKDVV